MTESKQQAQLRVDSIHSFQQELVVLEKEKIVLLTEEQKQSITSYHTRIIERLSAQFDVDCNVEAKQLSLGMRVASFLGALAFAASVFFLFYQYWGRLSTVVQVSILCGASLLSFGITVLIRSRDLTGYFTKLAALVAYACFVLNIEMFGQIFNITPSDRAFIVWGAMAFLLAYACELRLLLVAGLLCVFAYISASVGEWGGLYWLDMGRRPEDFFPAAILIFCLPLLIRQDRFSGFATTYRLVGGLAALLTILVLSFWGDGSYLNWDKTFIEHCYQVTGFICSAAVIWVGAQYHWRELSNTGVVFFVIFLFTKFYDWWWENMPKYLFFLVVGLTALLALFVLRRLRGEDSAKTRSVR